MIYIAYNYNSKVIGVVNAKTKELASAFWQGRDIIPHTVKSLEDFMELENHPTGVYPLLEIVEEEAYQFRNLDSSTKILTVK